MQSPVFRRFLATSVFVAALSLAAQQPEPTGQTLTGGARELGTGQSPSAPVTLPDAPVLGATGEADLEVFHFTAADLLDPGATLHYSLDVANRSAWEARNVLLRIELRAGTTLLRATPVGTRVAWSCEESPGVVSCSTSRFPFGSQPFRIEVKASDSLRGGVLTAEASISSETPDPRPANNRVTKISRVWRHSFVSSASDAGPGSLRDVIEEANRDCDRDGVPCRILFRIPAPVPETGWFTIRLASPLPPLTVTDFSLDGTTQTAATGQTNPAGPEIELTGDLLEEGDGLEIQSRGRVEISGLAINGFPENGIVFNGTLLNPRNRSPFASFYLVANNFIGTDPTGTVAVPNALRGVACFVEPAFSTYLTIRSNLLSGNGRSGVFIHSGQQIFIEGNRIGLKAAVDEPLPNGASGIYFGVLSSLACVSQNVIAYNTHFGIAVERAVNSYWIERNSIKGNAIYGLDIGLDLATPGGAPGIGVVGRPVLTSARYDEATGTTTIAGSFPSPTGLFAHAADLYSNTAFELKGEGETWLGSARADPQGGFVFPFQGNLLGKSITATTTLTRFNGFIVAGGSEEAAPPPLCQSQGFLQQTSEFSDPILVTR